MKVLIVGAGVAGPTLAYWLPGATLVCSIAVPRASKQMAA
jgi:2-polyprenyl-6-methoxyphenol hydroxylase-like FAD-dependent oxidoreductase